MTNWKALRQLVAAMELGAATSAVALPSRTDLSIIKEYIERRDDIGLRAILAARPDLLENIVIGDDFHTFVRTQPPSNPLVTTVLANASLRTHINDVPYWLDDDIIGDELQVFLCRHPRDGWLTDIELADPVPRTLTRAEEVVMESNY